MELEELVQLCNKEGVTAVARKFGVTRQAIHKRVKKHPNYKPRKPPTAPSCPKCGSDRTANNGTWKTTGRQYICNACTHGWREKLVTTPISEILRKI